MVRKILTADNPILRKPSKKVERFDERLAKLVTDMFDTLETQKDPEGVGLAAVQIGILKQVFVFFEDDDKTIRRCIINPTLLDSKKGVYDKEKEPLEGCLSIPHYYGPLIRPREVTIAYQNIKGEKLKEKFSGFAAQIILHEMDHLNGILFVDRLFEAQKPLYEHKNGKWYEVEI